MGINCWMSPAKTPALRRSRWLNDGAARSEPTVCCGLRLVLARCYFLPALSDGLLQECVATTAFGSDWNASRDSEMKSCRQRRLLGGYA